MLQAIQLKTKSVKDESNRLWKKGCVSLIKWMKLPEINFDKFSRFRPSLRKIAQGNKHEKVNCENKISQKFPKDIRIEDAGFNCII